MNRLPRMEWVMLTACGLGCMRPASGTWGSMPPVVFALALVWLWSESQGALPVWIAIDLPLVVVCIAFTIACVRFGARGEQHFGRKDASSIVADEVAGQSLVLLFLPWRSVSEAAGGSEGAWQWNLMTAAIAFVVFRVMDVIKLPPARSLQRMPGGVGIVVDDLVAAVHALIVTQIAVRFVLPLVF